MANRRGICWIRRDLRTYDHRALSLATSIADEVAVLFVFDTEILRHLKPNDRRLTFIRESLVEVNENLAAKGSQLVVRYGNPVEIVPQFAKEFGAAVVVTARDYEPYARTRDEEVSKALAGKGIDFQTVKDSVVFEGGELYSAAGTPFRVYTPYSKAWREKFNSGAPAAGLDNSSIPITEHAEEAKPDATRLAEVKTLAPFCQNWEYSDIGFERQPLVIAPGQKSGKASLKEFALRADKYGELRDFPGENGTSNLSVHFRFGTISIRDAVRHSLNNGTKGADKWLAELIWRDFYQDLIFNHPKVVSEPFQPQYKDLPYPGSEEHYLAWEKGTTGYPIVDAAMRCLNATGTMHNRLRMIVASFLTKDLLVDYRKGEAYFAERLLDFDLASNNGGWQWAASVGADAQPYFRIFSPYLQSVKFDPEGKFMRKWLPELKNAPNEFLHSPATTKPMEMLEHGIVLGETYPFPIVDHSVQRQFALELLGAAKANYEAKNS